MIKPRKVLNMYNRLLRAGLATALFAVVSLAAVPPTPDADSGQIAFLVSRMLEQGHYLRRPFDEGVSKQFLQFYLDALDPNHLTFFQSDVEEFQGKYANRLHDETKRGNVQPAFDIFTRFLQRTEQRAAFAKSVLNEEMAFDGQDSIVTDRRELPWPANEAEAQALWRQWVKHEVLTERLNKEKPEEISKIITRRYERLVRSVRELDGENVLEIYLTALAHVYDPHSDYLSASDLENFSISMKLSLVGIGAVLTSEDGYVKVVSIAPGGPADLDKRLKPNDRIVGVAQEDGPMVDVVDMRLQKVVEMIRGKKGTTVRLLVIPATATDPSTRVEIKLVRDEIKLTEQEAKGKIVEMPGPNGKIYRLGYIDLPSFYADMKPTANSKSTTRDVRRLIEHMKTQGIEGLVLDLRRNGGGALNEAINLTGLFIKDGPVVQVKDTLGRIQVIGDTDSSVAYDGPLVVLTSHVSASASEILAGALQDYGRAVIVGEKSTFGKGTVQSMLEVGNWGPERDGKKPAWGALKMTTSKFYRVAGGSTQNRGIIPDVQLPSVLDYRKVSETALKNALPYDEVLPAKYESVNLVPPHLTELRKRSAARVAQNPEFRYVFEDIERAKAQLQDKSISLNEAKRMAEKEAETARNEARKKERKERAQHTPFKVTEVTLGGLDGGAATPTGFTKKVMEAAAQTSGEQTPPEPEVDPVFEEGFYILADLIQLSGSAAR